MRDGGYDDGYSSCPCFWGEEPGSMVRKVVASLDLLRGVKVLDVGCGEGKNAAYLAVRGATVDAIDVSEAALRNARQRFGHMNEIMWQQADVSLIPVRPSHYDIVIAYGLLHCLATEDEVLAVIRSLQASTNRGGLHVVCTFNDRRQELSAHPGFRPCLLPHRWFENAYSSWNVEFATDEDLHETHPHNGIAHVHSLTRMICRRTN